jgi:ADP-heptose:LPS heptosyltransferase
VQVFEDCRFFRGNVPCYQHKTTGVHCRFCKHYERTDKKILIIKLGAAGDVVRTTPLIHRIKRDYRNAELTWISSFPELVPRTVDQIMNFELKNVLVLLDTRFDLVINLDKDPEACALADMVPSASLKGFKLNNGKVIPANKGAQPKWLTGLFDDLNIKNKKSYLQEIFEIYGSQFNGEKYILDKPRRKRWSISKKLPLVGLNTGCGERWPTRLWPEQHWIKLIELLQASQYNVILLGGAKEDNKNRNLSEETGATYLGHFALDDFIGLLDQCDLIVTAVTLALHLAIGLGKKIVLFNNIFNRYEFELYGLGEIIEPNLPCQGCFKSSCDQGCMAMIDPSKVFAICKGLLKSSRRG